MSLNGIDCLEPMQDYALNSILFYIEATFSSIKAVPKNMTS
jgi:hypothetical protein